eukprot:TRINITY_DN33739_c0_g1_i1.p1 TRINITY_DN33739_c0_g1~~TRINITY_DN33739_c0_g1_i1.p1  ORF type:complete len:372 (-),score=47.93 TRINITY_DN33739_c0_g1_i1:41-1156(-)
MLWKRAAMLQEATLFFWIDLFCLNQHPEHEMKPWERLQFAKNTIGRIGSTVWAFQPNESGLRPWAAWELYCTERSATFDIVMSGQAQNEFNAKLLNSYEQACFKIKDNLARCLREKGEFKAAEDAFRALASEIEASSAGIDSSLLLNCWNQLAVTLQKSSDFAKRAEAKDLLRKILKSRMDGLGTNHEDTLQACSNLAVLLTLEETPLTQKNYNEASMLYRMALSGRRATIGSLHPRTLYTMTNLACLLSHAPVPSQDTFDEAEALHSEAVQGFRQSLQELHPLTMTALHHQACHWLARHDFKSVGSSLESKGMKLLDRVLQLRTSKLGGEHPDTCETRAEIQKRRFAIDVKCPGPARVRSPQADGCKDSS